MAITKLQAFRTLAALALISTITATGQAATIVTEILNSPTLGQWSYRDMAAGGTASIVDLTGVGGNLESNQPLPSGAVLLTTDGNDASRAQVGILGDFGDAATFLNNVQLSYEYYKAESGNLYAAPSLKLEISAAGGTGDNYGHLIYEPGWNQAAPGSQQVPTGDWQVVAIDSDTGSGGDGSGGWWWSGGFEVPSSAGGPPLRSLAEWVTTFQASDPTDFAAATIVGIQVGVGTYNQDQIVYFDNVSYAVTGGGSATWDFQAPVPEPGTIALAGLAGIAGLAIVRRRRGK